MVWSSEVRVAGHCGFVAIEVLILLDRVGGAKRDRTADLLVANEALSQLSYSPTRWEQPSISLAAIWGVAEAPQVPARFCLDAAQGLEKLASRALKRSSR
jgi:hypothetical protein